MSLHIPHRSSRNWPGLLAGLALAAMLGSGAHAQTPPGPVPEGGTAGEAAPAQSQEGDVVTTPSLQPPIGSAAEVARGHGTFAAVAQPCWSEPPRWLLQAEGKDSDVLNLVICLGHGVTWDEVFEALRALEGRKVVRRFAPDYHVPWREVKHPVRYRQINEYCINPVQAEIDARGARDQDVSAREGGCRTLLLRGVNHFRAWQQEASMAIFVGASTERPCRSGLITPSHCIVSYDEGRELLFNDLVTAAGNAGITVHADVYTYQAGGGQLTQADGSSTSYDGKARVVTLSR